MGAKDERVGKVKELVSGIKLIKCAALEVLFRKRIGEARATEVRKLFYSLLCYTVIMTVFLAVPLLIMLATFGSYVLLGNRLTAVIAFPAISILNQLRVPLVQLPDAISRVAEMNVSLKRIQRLLAAEELPAEVMARWGASKPCPPAGGNGGSEVEGPAVEIRGGAFSYGGSEPILKDVSMEVAPGQLVAVGGSVGAGKSSLLLAMLGEMARLGGQCEVRGTVSYVSQEPFVISATLRENILFGLDYDEAFYKEVVHACCLASDFEILPDGDLSEIGESGVNISGGQKQRVNLARAVYRRSEIFLFDDPLSAVDAHVGEHIYEECILKLLKGKTRVLVTHGLQFMKKCDFVFIMKEGRIHESGTFTELEDRSQMILAAAEASSPEPCSDTDDLPASFSPRASPRVDLQDLRRSMSSGVEDLLLSASIRDASIRDDGDDDDDDEGGSKSGRSGKSLEGEEGAKLIAEEGRRTGNVAKAIYVTYLKAAGGWPTIFAVFLISAFSATVPIASQWWISLWTENQFGWSQDKYLKVFALFIGLATLVFVSRGLLVCLAAVRAAKKMHGGVMDSLLAAPLSFFHTTPQGRIMNRCSSDMETVDEQAAPVHSPSLIPFSPLFSASIFPFAVERE